MKALRGHPEIGPSARMLGVRGGIDIPVERGLVRPGTGGMSVAPETPINLPRHRRPPGLGGSGKDPVWCIGQSCLGPSLRFRRDSPTHGVVEPSRVMTIGEYEAALAETLGGWGLVP
ncbi:MAG: hypothetical protein IT383_06815 [Deltaproteobacteria bacterium]|nr:hypothetical protein [Deltaproteobacteria bacterium]